MHTLIGEKHSFGIEIEIIKTRPHLWGKVALWVDGTRLGNFEDENILSAFINTLANIVYEHKSLWEHEFEGLSCKEIFYRIHPFYNNPEGFFDLSDSEQRSLERYDKFLFQWGESFDNWTLRVVVKDSECNFLWVHAPDRDFDTYEVRNNVKCGTVGLNQVIDGFNKLQTMVPDHDWPEVVRARQIK